MKPHLLLIHGALGCKAQFDSIIPKLEKHYQTHRFNFEGHGNRKSDRPFSIVVFSENLIKHIEENNLEKVNIFGYSMGGYVALYTVLSRPELFNKIITLGTKFNWLPETAKKEVKMLNPEVIKEKVPQFAQRLIEFHGSDRWEDVLHKTADMMIDLGNNPLLKKEDLSKIDHEVVIGIGSLDRMVSRHESVWAADHLPNGSCTLLENVKHPIEHVDAAIIFNFIHVHT